MAGAPRKPKLVDPDPPKKETEPAKQFDSTSYFKEALALRKPLAPVIRKTVVTADVRVERPHGDAWFQLNPNEKAAFDAYVVKDADKRYYYVTDAMLTDPVLYPRLKPVILVEGALWPPEVPYIVPFHYPDPDREIPAYTSAWVAYEQARAGIWTQMRWEDGAYKVWQAENNPHPATFSGKDLSELLAIGFKDRIINDPSHPYVRKLRGDVSD
jgi:hypothetical protein